MGYTTDFIGHLDIEPALNAAEVAYLTAFSRTRRWDREGGPYAVPTGEPREWPPTDLHRFHVPAPGQPSLWCDWLPCEDGCCLVYSGNERFAAPVGWLRYLIEHFLKPGAAGRGEERLAGFGFDHVLNGMVVGCRRDLKQLFSLVVRDNTVSEEVLHPADRRYVGHAPWAYERALDRRAVPEQRRNERDGVVVPFTRRA